MDDSSPLRIVHTESSTGWGGQEIRILAEAEGMQRRGHRVELLCPPDAQIFRAAADRGLEVTALPIERKKVRGVLSLRDWFARNTASVINTHSSTDSWLVALATATLGDRPPLVRTRHVSTPVSNKASTRWLYTRATCHIVTTGETLRHQLAQSNGFALDRMTSVPTGIDLGRFVPAADRRLVRAQLGIPPDGHLVGILATLRDWKGHRYLVDAFAAMNNPDSHLLIVGDGPEWGRIKEQVERLGLGSRVIMPGNQNDVTPWLQSMDVFALPSYANEGIPQALMQAMACGLPV
ncbi:MAG: glycosyltransferase family 4 protein, partial [Casimicrobiaceae bacterium]